MEAWKIVNDRVSNTLKLSSKSVIANTKDLKKIKSKAEQLDSMNSIITKLLL